MPAWEDKLNTNPQNYSEFWDFYVHEHSLPLTRLLHLIGTTLGLALLVFFVARGQWYFFPVFFVAGYGFAWFSHFFIEKNRPASFRYPFWSFISDFKMIGLMLAGRMAAEVERVRGEDGPAGAEPARN